MKIVNTRTYIESQNIRVFPCAYRGYYNGTEQSFVFDPEARATTEANFTNTFHKLSNNKESYVIAWIPNSGDGSYGTLKCVIGGYYFEIYNHKIADFFYEDEDTFKPYYLCIRTNLINLGTADVEGASNADRARTTSILQSFYDATEFYLDIQTDNDYVFTGLAISKTTDTDDITAFLAPFVLSPEWIPAGSASSTDKASQVGKFYVEKDEYEREQFIRINAEEEIPKNGTPLYIQQNKQILDPSQFSITNILDAGKGKYSVRMLEDTTPQGNNTTIAAGNYSIALGRSTIAEGEASTALGDDTLAQGDGSFATGILTRAAGHAATALNNQTEATGDSSIAFGSNTKAEGTNAVAGGNDTSATAANAVALGDHTKATQENQVVIGKYSVEDEDQAFIIANGNSSLHSNKFTVSYDGDIKALGNLEVNGNKEIQKTTPNAETGELETTTEVKPAISSTGAASNDFVLGTTAKNSCGSITVYGESESETPIFNVANTGNTTIAGVTKITSTEDSINYQSGALQVAGGASIAKDLYVGGKLTVKTDSGTDLKGTLAVADAATFGSTVGITDKATITGGLEVQNDVSFLGSDKRVKIEGVTQILNETDNGALRVTGGVNIGKQLEVWGATSLHGNLWISKAETEAKNNAVEIGCSTAILKDTDSSSAATGALKVTGGVGVGKNLNVGGAMAVDSTVTVVGATTIKDATTINGITTITNTTDYTNSDETPSAACIINGGAYIAKKLHVGGDTTFRDNLEITQNRIAIKTATESNTANSGALVVNGGVGIGKNLNVTGNSTISGNLTLASTSGSNSLTIGSGNTNNTGGSLSIYGAGVSEVFTVTKTGDVYATGELEVGGLLSVGDKITIGKAVEVSATGITGLPSLTVNGTINAITFNAQSDARLKTNIEDYTFRNSILDLPIKQFKYIKDDTHTKYIGCLAQDLQEICPEFVTQNSEGFLSIQESKIIYALLQEVKGLRERIELLERK